MELVIDILLLAIVGIVTFLVAQDGPWNAILTFFSVIFSGLLAMNFFEPLAMFLGKQIPAVESRADFLSLVGLFAIFVFAMRLGLEQLTPSNLQLPEIVYKVGQWGFGLATGYVTMAILLTSLHTVPLPRTFLGFTPERPNFLGISKPDVQWLGFTQHVTERVFARRFTENGKVFYRNFDGMRIQFPNTSEPTYLPTFILRYATRRQKLGGGGTVAAAPPIQAQPVRPGQPQMGPAL
jgi:hypothetical protein